MLYVDPATVGSRKLLQCIKTLSLNSCVLLFESENCSSSLRKSIYHTDGHKLAKALRVARVMHNFYYTSHFLDR